MAFPKNKRTVKILRMAGCLLLVQLIASFLLTKLIYDAAFPRYDYTPQAEPQTYSDITDLMEQTDFFSGDNRLHGRLFDGEGNSLVVIVQGINSHPEAYYPLIHSVLTQSKRDVFIFDMTGSCGSEGANAVGFSQSIYDLNAALDHIDERFNYEVIFLLGHSRGGYAACCTLADRRDIDGVIAINSPNSAMEAVIGPVADRIGLIAYANYPMLWFYQTLLFDAETVSRSAAQVIAERNIPVLVIHTEEDQTVPAARYSIYAHRDTAKGEHVDFLLLPGDHISFLSEQSLINTADSFFDSIEAAQHHK